MAKVEIYSWSHCPFCNKAKALLDSKNIEYTDYDITGDEAGRDKMVERTGGPRSVPQIFIDDKHIGGCDDIHMLDVNGELDTLLAV